MIQPGPGQEEQITVNGTIPVIRDSDFKDPFVRAKVTFRLIWIFAFTIVATFVTFWLSHGTDWRDIKDIIELVITPEVAILGSAIGFYFGNGRR